MKREIKKKRLMEVDAYLEMNRKAKIKEDFMGMYLSMMEHLGIVMNITKEEFERLSIESVRKLNEEALNDIKEQLQAA